MAHGVVCDCAGIQPGIVFERQFSLCVCMCVTEREREVAFEAASSLEGVFHACLGGLINDSNYTETH